MFALAVILPGNSARPVATSRMIYISLRLFVPHLRCRVNVAARAYMARDTMLAFRQICALANCRLERTGGDDDGACHRRLEHARSESAAHAVTDPVLQQGKPVMQIDRFSKRSKSFPL